MSLISWVKDILHNGIRITFFTTGRAFDPSTQDRTDPIIDIINNEDNRKGCKMGFFNGWKSWSQWLWDTWGHKIQNEADVIQGWQFSPDLQALVDNTWNDLSPDIQKALANFIHEIYVKYGEAAAEKIFGNNLTQLKDTPAQ